MQQPEKLTINRFVSTAPIVYLCGSMKHRETFIDMQISFAREGSLVLMPHTICIDNRAWKQLKHELAPRLLEIHKRNIDIAHTVYVINKEKYIDPLTAKEIEYAVSIGKPVKYLEEVS